MRYTTRLFAAICLQTIAVVSVLAQPDTCSAILKQGITNKFQSIQYGSYNAVFRKALCLSREQVDAAKASGSTDISIPIAEVFLGIGAQAEYQRIQELRVKYCSSSNTEIATVDLNLLTVEVNSPEVVNAWRDCMIAKMDAVGGQWDIEGFDRNLNFQIRWGASPQVYSAKIGKVSVTGAKCDKSFLSLNTVVSTQWLPMPCTRDADGKAVSIAVQFKPTSLGGVSAQLPAIVNTTSPPSPLPQCQYEVAYKKQDVAGNQYKEVFTTAPGAPGVQMRGIRAGIVSTYQYHYQTLFLTAPSGRIYDVAYSCEGGGCRWSYNIGPNTPGTEYRVGAEIAPDGRSFTWRRNWNQTLPLTERYTAFYEVPEQACKNCPNCKP